MPENDILHDFEAWAGALMERLSAAERKKLTMRLARELRKSQSHRIAQQKNPDGSRYAPRKSRRDAHDGRIKRRKMFAKLRTAKHLKIRATTSEAIVQFRGKDARIARVSQYGLRDRVAPDGPTVRYPRRVLLGFTDADRQLIEDLLMEQLTGD